MMPVAFTRPHMRNMAVVASFFFIVASAIGQVVPAPKVGIFGYTVREAAAATFSVEEYAGVVAWINKDSLKITDTFGTQRTFVLDSDTSVLKAGNFDSVFGHYDIHVFNHVRVSVVKDDSQERAQTVTLLQ
jgi:hypothetical protein